MIDMGLYRRFYRQKRRSFASAGDGAIREEATSSTSSSISPKDTGFPSGRQLEAETTLSQRTAYGWPSVRSSSQKRCIASNALRSAS